MSQNNRIIKFRVWDKTKKEWWSYENKAYLNVSLTFDGRPLFWTGDECRFEGKFWPHENWVIQQFTGLHDKNGREIYEGDVVTGLCFDYRSYCLGKIEYYKGKFIAIALAKFIEGPADVDSPNVEVVGNIFENPDLITP